MASAGQEKRRQLLEDLKAKRLGAAAAVKPVQVQPLSPDATRILVPNSSSPAPSPVSESRSYASKQSSADPRAANVSAPRPGTLLFPSSNLGRVNGGGAAFTTKTLPGASSNPPTGSPVAVLNAIHVVRDTYPAHVSKPVPTPAIGTTSLSRTIPQAQIQRPSSSPTQSSSGPINRIVGGATSASASTTPRTPSLVAAARQQHDAELEAKIDRLSAQFRRANRAAIAYAISRNPNNMEQVMKDLTQVEVNVMAAASASHSSPTPSHSLSSLYQYRPSVPGVVTSTATSSMSSSPAPVVVPTPTRQARPRKNEKSTIYAKREKGGNRRDDDDGTESDAESEQWSAGSWSGDEGPRKKKRRQSDDDVDAEGEALRAFNTAEKGVLTGTIACSDEQAEKIIHLRPFRDADDVRNKLSKARGVSFRLFEQFEDIMEGYVQIDACLNRCESIANEISATLAVWKGASTLSDSVIGTPRSDGLNDVKVDVNKVSELLRNETNARRKKILSSYVQTQPALLSKGTILKDYQLLGVNWLNLLYSRKIGCILADEMGLGKTIQVIAFLAHLKERDIKGPHMIFVPASTLENWTREFEKFAPGIDVQTYFGSQAERAELRDSLKRKFRSGKLEVVLASYTQVTSSDDLSFFRRKIQFETCVYDEGHALKNFATKRYNDLLSIKPRWRLLLTGTPLQNNLQELVSLLMFIHKDVFTDAEPYLRAIFKVQAQGQVNLLSQNRTSRARTMLTPFVLRRRKAHVLTLPPKIEKIEHCVMTPVQARLYRETLRRSRKVIQDLGEDALEDIAAATDESVGKKKPAGGAGAKGKKAKSAAGETPSGNSSNILMDLRKAASHPLLFRQMYNKTKVTQIARACLNTTKWCDSNFDYVVEDLEIMSDAEIHAFVSEHEELEKFALKPSAFLEGGKVMALQAHIERCKAEDKRMLLFSQFTMILDILQVALDHLGVRFIRLDGNTKTDERQGLVDQFNEDSEITVFLLSTKAGGVGINLTAASVVVIYDQDFNPHNDRQAADRAYRIGQEREVEVIKLISKDSIDEDILSIGVTKLQLDDAVGGEEITLDAGDSAGAGAGDDKTAKEVKKSLLTQLRTKFEAQADVKAEDDEVEEIKIDTTPTKESTPLKRARGMAARET